MIAYLWVHFISFICLGYTVTGLTAEIWRALRRSGPARRQGHILYDAERGICDPSIAGAIAEMDRTGARKE